MAVQTSAQPLGIFLLRDHHPVDSQLFQHPAVGLIVGLADDVRNLQFLQVHGDQHRSRQVIADGDDRTVHIPDTQCPQHILVLGISHHSVGHIVCHQLHQIAAHIHCQHLRPQGAKLLCKRLSKQAQADNCVRFHNHSPYPISRFVSA